MQKGELGRSRRVNVCSYGKGSVWEDDSVGVGAAVLCECNKIGVKEGESMTGGLIVSWTRSLCINECLIS